MISKKISRAAAYISVYHGTIGFSRCLKVSYYLIWPHTYSSVRMSPYELTRFLELSKLNIFSSQILLNSSCHSTKSVKYEMYLDNLVRLKAENGSYEVVHLQFQDIVIFFIIS